MVWQFFKNYMFSKRAGSFVKSLSWISVCGIAISMMSLVVVASVMNGFNGNLREKMLVAEPDMVIFGEDHQAIQNVLKARPEVKNMSSFIQTDIIIKTLDGAFGGGLAKGMEPQALKIFLDEIYTSGKLGINKVHYDDFGDLQANEVIMGYDLARNLGLFEGDQFIVMPPEVLLSSEAPIYEKVTIKRIIQTEVVDVDKTLMIYNKNNSLKRFSQIASVERGVEINVVDPENISVLAASLGKKWQIETWMDRHGALLFALNLEKLAMSLFLSLATLITSFSLITVLVLLITQKRRDIALMMAMGYSVSQARKLFISVGILLSSLGMGIGIVLGVILSLIIENFSPNIMPDIYYDSSIPAHLDLPLLGILVLFAIGLALFSSWLPVRVSLNKSIIKMI